MEVLFAPWRTEYVKGIKKPDKCKNCVFCKPEQFVLGKYKHCNVILNLYPYSAGHLLIIPKRHVENLHDLNQEELNEFMLLTKEATRILKEKSNAQGINIGMNLGAASGAGIPEHIHMHVLPRWPQDTGFLCTIGNTKVVSINLDNVYKDLKPEFERINT